MGYVSLECFCDRESKTERLVDAFCNGCNVVVEYAMTRVSFSGVSSGLFWETWNCASRFKPVLEHRAFFVFVFDQ